MERQNQRFHIGMRIIKTVIAVFVCGLLGYARGESAFYSMIAALICLQNSTGKTIESSMNRALGTLLGGLAGVLVVYLLDLLGVLYIEPLRYLVSALALIPLIEITLLIKRPAISAFACVVFLCVTVNHSVGDIPAIFALRRMFETLVGVAVACILDLFLPYRPPAQPEEQPGQDAPPSAEPEDGENAEEKDAEDVP